jgi:hypothetical protein
MLNNFKKGIESLRKRRSWIKSDIIKLCAGMLPDFAHIETGK